MAKPARGARDARFGPAADAALQLALAAVVGVLSGLASAAFLASLDWVTNVRLANPWLLFLLPLAGAAIAWTYRRYAGRAAGGTNLILDEIHAPGGAGVPLRMLPLILGSTLVTHLFGGSAGREGTAVQMGGAIAGGLARRLSLDPRHARALLMAGISGGFAGVFGTPLAGTIFGMEVLAVGGIAYAALLPCLAAAVAAHLTVLGLGIAHAEYAIAAPIPHADPATLAKVALAAVAFGLVAAAFSELTGLIEREAKALVADPVWRTALGGVAVVLVTLLLGTRAYNGLSLPLISASLDGTGVPTFAFLFKLVLTALTLGVGFKGGEVTPLFVIGATLGATLGGPLGEPPAFLAALGFVAVFGAAANTPLACIVMGVELFGGAAAGPAALFFGVAVIVAYTVSGQRGIYHAQRVLAPKFPASAAPDPAARLSELRPSREAFASRLVGRSRPGHHPHAPQGHPVTPHPGQRPAAEHVPPMPDPAPEPGSPTRS